MFYIAHYKSLFFTSIQCSFENPNIQAADTNNDWILTWNEFNDLTDKDKLLVQRELGKDGLDEFVKTRTHEYDTTVHDSQQKLWELKSESLREDNEISITDLFTFPPKHPKALQEFLASGWHYNSRVDGKFGPISRKALQSFLQQEWFYTMQIDGIFWNWSQKALDQFKAQVKPSENTKRIIDKIPYLIWVYR